MRSFLLLLVVLLAAGSAGAVVDPDPDQMGVYFDRNADQVCRTTTGTQVLEAYLIYTRPSLATIRGFECKVRLELPGGGSTVLLDSQLEAYGINLETSGADEARFLVGFHQPVATSEAMVLATIQIFRIDDEQVDLYLEPADPASLDSAYPLVVAADYSLHAVGISAPYGPSASVNGDPCQVVATDEAAWDSIKAMYR